mgnify:CR=1 FL=1
MKTIPLFVSTLLGFLWLVAMATPASAAPDLVPILTTPPNGTVGVRNTGTTAAGPTLLLVHCVAGGGGRCPSIPPDQMAAYSHPAFPDQIIVRVPALRPGGRFMHHLRFWDQLCWPAGGAVAPAPATYVISARADAANSEAEGANEGNNYVESTLVSQRRDCPAGPDAKPDLVPIPNGLPSGNVIVWNNGTAAAGPTLLLVHCVARGGGRCPPIPPDQMAAYAHPSFPDQIVVRVPALQPRTRFDHRLTFWNQLCWPAGSYVISARADIGNSETESNEGNNYVEAPLVSQRSCAGAARPPFDPSNPPHATPVPGRPVTLPVTTAPQPVKGK